MSAPGPGSDDLVRPDASGTGLRVVIATVVVVVLGGVGLVVHDARDGDRPLERGTATHGPLGTARSTVASSLLAASDGPPVQMRTAGDVVLVVHADAVRAVDPSTGALLWSRPTAAGERIVRSLGDPAVAVTLAETGARRLLTAVDPVTGATRWTREVDAPDEPIPQPVGAASPAMPRGIVVTPGAILLQYGDVTTPRLVGLDPQTGERRWEIEQGGRMTDADDEVIVLVRTGEGDGSSTSFDVVDLLDGTLRWGAELGAGGIDVTAHAQVVPGGLVVTADGIGDVRGHRRTDGEVVWHLEEARRGEALALSDEHVLVTQDRTRAYVGIDAADGFVRWRHDWLVPGPIALATEGGRAIVVSAHERVAGLSLDHGSRVWELDLDRAGALVAAGGNLIHADRRGRLTASSAATGRERWTTLPTSSRRIHLAAADGLVITAAPVGATENHELTAFVDGEPLWTASLRVGGIGSLIIDGGRVLASASGSAGGELVGAFDLETGDPVSPDLDAGAEAGADVRFTVTTSGELVVEEPDGTRRWSYPLPGTTHLDPIEVDGTVVTVVGALVLGHDLDDGRETWRATLPGPIVGTPVRAGGAVIAASTDGTVRALDPADGTTIDHYLLAPLHAGPVSDGHLVHVVTTGGELITLGPRDPQDEVPSPPPIQQR